MTKKATTKPSKSVVKITKTGINSEQPNVVKNTKKDENLSEKTQNESAEPIKTPAKKHVPATELSSIKHHEPQKIVNRPHWYHFVALLVVLALAGFAIYKLIHRFDFSLLGAQHYVDVYYGCATTNEDGELDKDDLELRTFGLHNGDMFGKDGLTADKESAYVRIVQFEGDYAIIDRRSDGNDWAERTMSYGNMQSIYFEKNRDDCTELMYFTIY